MAADECFVDRENLRLATCPFPASWIWIFLILLGLGLRTAGAIFTTGSPDIILWQAFGATIVDHGLASCYSNFPLCNHPPIISKFVGLLVWCSRHFEVSFPILLRLCSTGADFLIGALLCWARWRDTKDRDRSLKIWAIYCIAPNPILIGGVHGNTDSICLVLTLLSAVLLQQVRAPFWSGLALGLSCNVKLLPIVLLPGLLSCLRSRAELYRYGSGFALALLPLAVAWVLIGDEYLRNVLLYQPASSLVWGFALLFRGLQYSTENLNTAVSLAKPMLLGFVSILGIRNALRFQITPIQITCLSLLVFTVCSPAFSLQYLIYLVPFLVYEAPIAGLLYSLLTGLMLAGLYFGFDSYLGSYLGFQDAHPVGMVLSATAWVFTTVVLYKALRRMRSSVARSAV